jgi:hypothetical protein
MSYLFVSLIVFLIGIIVIIDNAFRRCAGKEV